MTDTQFSPGESAVEAAAAKEIEENKLDFVKEIFDNVLGFIPLTGIELEIINNPLFQRLKRIAQLGNAVHVFPGATHSRFSHSLGVMHIAGRMAKKVAEDSNWSDSDIQKLRLAGLLHDIGHYPCSHVIEQVYKEESEEYHHEKIGARVVNETELSDIIRAAGFDPDEIGKIFTGNHEDCRYNQILRSELDADRMDYLLRDSYHIGVNYGNFDIDQIIRKLKISEEGFVSIDYHAQRTVEHYLIARFNLYTQVITHKTIGAFDAMLKMIYKGGIESDIFPAIDDILRKTEDYESFDDYMLLEGVRSLRSSKDDVISQLAEMYTQRMPLKCAVQKTHMVTEENQSKDSSNYSLLKYFLRKETSPICSDIPNRWVIIEAGQYTELCPALEPKSAYQKNETEGSLSYEYKGQDLSKCIFISKRNESWPLVYDSSSLISSLAGARLELCRAYTLDKYRSKLEEFLTDKNVEEIVKRCARA